MFCLPFTAYIDYLSSSYFIPLLVVLSFLSSQMEGNYGGRFIDTLSFLLILQNNL